LKQLGNVNFDRSTRLPDLFGSSLLTIAVAANGWSIYGAQRAQPVATGGKWDALEKPLKQADPQLLATHGNRFAAHGKEGSPVRVRKRALIEALQTRVFGFPVALHFLQRARL
jgi:hypothetical protein